MDKIKLVFLYSGFILGLFIHLLNALGNGSLPVCGNFHFKSHFNIKQFLVFTQEQSCPFFGGFQLKLQGFNSCLKKECFI